MYMWFRIFINGLGFNKFLGNQGANFNCHPSNIVNFVFDLQIRVIDFRILGFKFQLYFSNLKD